MANTTNPAPAALAPAADDFSDFDFFGDFGQDTPLPAHTPATDTKIVTDLSGRERIVHGVGMGWRG